MGERPEGASPGTCTERRTSAKNLRIDTNQKSKDVQRHISVHIRHIINKKQKCHRASHLKPRRCPLTANRRRRKDTTQDQCKTCELLIHRNETFHCFQYFPIRFAIWVTFPTDTCFWKRSNISFDVFPWNFEGHVSSLAAVSLPIFASFVKVQHHRKRREKWSATNCAKMHISAERHQHLSSKRGTLQAALWDSNTNQKINI